ncbi:MAG: TrkH family potassium uptake protein [Spirochaetales bacterium]
MPTPSSPFDSSVGRRYYPSMLGKRTLKSSNLVAGALILGVVSLLLEPIRPQPSWLFAGVQIIDFVTLALALLEVGVAFAHAPVKRNYLRSHVASFALLLLFVALFAYNKTLVFQAIPQPSGGYQSVLIIRNVFLLLKVFTRLRGLSEFVTSVVRHPAQTVALSFLLVIGVGTLVLMMPFTTIDGEGLPFVDALFTATSAVCVTGLVVVDTASVFTVWGQITILVLIQVGGLGIMVLSLFSLVLVRHSMSVESHLLLSYMLDESRIADLSASLRRIVLITFGCELAGAIALFGMFGPMANGFGHRVMLAVFHAVSAFCNAGFTLFTTSLEQFHRHVGINMVIAVLIIAGGLSFSVLTNAFQVLRNRFEAWWGQRSRRQVRLLQLTVKSRAVLIGSGVLILVGFFGFYTLEHGRAMAGLPLGSQYLAAFFQSVTLRTAGFNTIPMGELASATYVFMILFMFIGGASGSTAGGLKINNVAVIAAFLNSRRRNHNQTLLFHFAVSDRQVNTAFAVLLFGLLSVFGGTFLLAITESASITDYLFETVSAFATVGLSTGLTSELTTAGRIVVTILMFVGRVGPLTLLAASSQPGERRRVRYPSAHVAAG